MLKRRFRGPVDEVFRAWTDGSILSAWYGPPSFVVRECDIDFRDEGRYRIVMAHEDGLVFVTKGSYRDIDRGARFTMSMNLEEHPKEFIEIFRPSGSPRATVPLIWELEVSFEGCGDETLVTLCTTYPVQEDCDQFVDMHGERGWEQGFLKLDRLLEG